MITQSLRGALAWLAHHVLRPQHREALAWLQRRVRDSLFKRPWLTDIACAFEEVVWGVSVHCNPHAVIHRSGFASLAPIIRQVDLFAIAVGLSTLVAAVLKLHRTRQVTSACGLILFGGLTLGVSTITGRASYMGWTLACFLIVLRIY